MPTRAMLFPTAATPHVRDPRNRKASAGGRCQDLPSALVQAIQLSEALAGASRTRISPLMMAVSPSAVVNPVDCQTTPDDDQYQLTFACTGPGVGVILGTGVALGTAVALADPPAEAEGTAEAVEAAFVGVTATAEATSPLPWPKRSEEHTS